MTRLTEQVVEMQIAEMWDAVYATPQKLRNAEWNAHREKCMKTQDDLRKRLAEQLELEAAAPELLEALKPFAKYFKDTPSACLDEFEFSKWGVVNSPFKIKHIRK